MCNETMRREEKYGCRSCNAEVRDGDERGIITSWNIKAGDNVAKGELIASINSEKIETEIEAPADGTVLDIAVSEDEGFHLAL